MTAFEDAAERVADGGDARTEASALVGQMALDEKLGCLDGDLPYWPGLMEMMAGGYNRRTWPAAAVERLGVPGLDFADGPRGCVVGPSTAFPVSMARGATFDPDLERRVGEAIGAELRANGATFTGAVCMNLLRHPAWGRAQETYGEDPHHVGEMAVAFAEGLQQHVMACMKHFALNSMENARFRVDVTADERALHEVYLPHFKRVAQSGVAGVMSAYNQVNGSYCGENSTLLTEILRDEWGWEGIVVSDFIAGLRDPVLSVEAGLNVEMPFRQQRAQVLAAAIDDGALAVDAVDRLVTETVATFLRFGRVFWSLVHPAVVAYEPHRSLAHDVAVASMVLLANDGVLPAPPAGVGKVAVLGRLAKLKNLGDGGSSNVLQPDVCTALQGIEDAYLDAEVVHADADVSIVDDADLVIVVVGYTADDEGEFIGSGEADGGIGDQPIHPPVDHPELGLPAGYEAPARPGGAESNGDSGFARGGDRDSLRLSADDEALIAATRDSSDKVVVVVMSGSAVVMPWLDDVGAVLMCWYPGMEGGRALGDVLTGAAEPGGRLPFAVPFDEADLVAFDKDADHVEYGLLHGQWYLDDCRVEAHRPFGFGLGYTSFDLSDAHRQNGMVRVTATNNGSRQGSTVVQVYGSVPDSEHHRPARRLVGFRRVHLEPGHMTDVDVDVDLAMLDLRLDGAWHTENAPVVLSVGLDSRSAVPISARAR